MSTAPQPYERQANFTSFEQQSPTLPKPGTSLDAELNAIRATLNAALARLSEIQRDDGALRNSLVTPDTLSAETLTLIGSDIRPRGVWAAGQIYEVRDLVQQGSVSYVASSQHLSTTFSADLSIGRWQALNSAASASDIPFSPTGGIVATNVQTALAEVQANASGRQPLATPLTQISALALVPSSFPYIGAGGTYLLGSSTTIGRIVMGASTPDVVRDAAGITPGTSPLNYVQLDSLSRLPSVDASQLINLNIPNGSITESKLADTLNLSSKTLTLPASLTPRFTREYTSAELTITNNGNGTLTHSLSAVPKFVQIRLVCKTSDLNYAINDEIVWGTMFQGFDKGVSVIVNSTSIIYRYAAVSAPFSYVDKNNGNVNALTNGNWRMVIRAWA